VQVQVSCLKEFPDEIEETFVFNLLAEQVHEDPVIDCVEAGLDIALQEPVKGRPFPANLP
jgi:hypothetical protein